MKLDDDDYTEYKTCELCGKTYIPAKYKFSQQKYCSKECGYIVVNRSRRAKAYEKELRNMQASFRWKVIKDPADIGALIPGLNLSTIEIEKGLSYGSFTEGTVLYDKKIRRTFVVHNNKLFGRTGHENKLTGIAETKETSRETKSIGMVVEQ